MRGLNMGGTYNALIQSATLCHPCGVRNYFCIFPGVPPLARLHTRAILWRPSPGLNNSARRLSPSPHNYQFVGAPEIRRMQDKQFLLSIQRCPNNRVGGFRPLTHHRTCLLWHTAVSRRVFSPGTTIPAATLYLSSSDTLTTPPHRYVDSDLHRVPSFSRGFVHFSTSWLCCCMF